MATRAQWAEAIQQAVGVEPYEEGSIAWVNLFVVEGSNAENNPDDTIQDEPGATPYNTFDGTLHVWNFPSFDEGLAAAKTTLENGDNEELLTALRNHKSAEVVTAAFVHSSWSGGAEAYINKLGETRADYAALSNVEVAPGPSSEPDGAVVTPPPTDIPMEPTDTETHKVEDAIAADAKAVDAEAVSGKVAAMKTSIADLQTHLSELEDLVK